MSLLHDFSQEEVDEAERYMRSTAVNERNRTKMLQALTITQNSRRSIISGKHSPSLKIILNRYPLLVHLNEAMGSSIYFFPYY